MTKICPLCSYETEQDEALCPVDKTFLKSASDDPMIGSVFEGKYEVIQLLGKGGMGTVYKARHVVMDRFVAIKLLSPHLVQDGLSMQRFQRESVAVSMLRHQNIVTVHDCGTTKNDVPYLIMDYIEGYPLSYVIKEEKRLDPARTVFLISQACDALAHAHNKGVIHRDLKPSNLVIERDENYVELLKVVDFGIAKLAEQSKEASALTSTGEIFGSPSYMSPEQCNGKPVTLKSDIYSLGCVLYECLSGEPPFDGFSTIETICKHVTDPPKFFAEIDPSLNISEKLESVVRKCLEKSPDARYANMPDLEADLRAALPDFVAQLSSGPRPKTALSELRDARLAAVGTREAAGLGFKPAQKLPRLLVAPDAPPPKEQVSQCSKCARPNRFATKFCLYCGTAAEGAQAAFKFSTGCKSCGHSDVLNTKHCINCGASLAPESDQAHAAGKANLSNVLENVPQKKAPAPRGGDGLVPSPNPTGNPWLRWIFPLCVMAVLICFVAKQNLTQPASTTQPPTSTQTSTAPAAEEATQFAITKCYVDSNKVPSITEPIIKPAAAVLIAYFQKPEDSVVYAIEFRSDHRGSPPAEISNNDHVPLGDEEAGLTEDLVLLSYPGHWTTAELDYIKMTDYLTKSQKLREEIKTQPGTKELDAINKEGMELSKKQKALAEKYASIEQLAKGSSGTFSESELFPDAKSPAQISYQRIRVVNE